MLKIKSLELYNVGRFVGEHKVDFSSKSGLIQVDALNKNTGGSSGAGKSTIFNALEYLLGINSLPATVLQSRLTKSGMVVKGSFDLNGKEVVLERSKSSGLSIKIDGLEVVSGNNKVAEEKLDEILSIPRDLLRKMVHKRQKEGGFFLNLTPKEIHGFLVEALDLRSWSARADKAELEAKTATQQLALVDSDIASSQESLTSLVNSLNSMQEPALGWDRSILNLLEKNLQKAAEEERAVSLSLASELSSIERPSPPPAQDRSSIIPIKNKILELKALDTAQRKSLMDRLQAGMSELSALEVEGRRLADIVDSGKAAESRLEKIKEQILIVKSGTCPTCKQHWNNGEAELERLIGEAKKASEAIASAKKAEEALPKLRLAIEDKAGKVKAMQAELAGPGPFAPKIAEAERALLLETERLDRELALINQAYQQQLLLVAEKEAEIRSKYEDRLAIASYNVREQSRLYTQKKTELDSYLSSLELYNKNMDILKRTEAELKEKLTLKIRQKKDLEERLGLAKDALAIIKSYTNTLFESALDQVAFKASEMLSRIPNMSTASIYFEGFKETRSGTIKEEVSAILTMDGEVGIPVKSMSGGERTAVDLAVDLAVVDMVESLAGKGIDLMILDEPFDGLDSICREQSLEVLKAYVTDKKIIVVDHSNETKELVSDRIFIVRDGQESRVCDSLT